MRLEKRLHERGYTGTLASVYRFLHRLVPPHPRATVRVEREPGHEAHVDFGYAGCMVDPFTGVLRKAWAFVMVLANSRHQYVEFVFDQTLPTWLQLHGHAFTFFGWVPHRVVLDNLKAAIVKAWVDDPQIQSTYRECAEHYGFLLAPCRPRTLAGTVNLSRGLSSARLVCHTRRMNTPAITRYKLDFIHSKDRVVPMVESR